MNIRLTAIEARIIGSLIEKQITTPDQYPLSLNALVNACNQKSNREPLLQLDEPTVKFVVDGLGPTAHGRGEIRIWQSRAQISADLLQYRVRQPQVHAAGNRDRVRAAVARAADARRAARARAAHGRAARSRRHRNRARGARERGRTARSSRSWRAKPDRRDSRWAQLFEELPESVTAGDRRRVAAISRRDAAPQRAPSNAELVARVATLEAEIAALARRTRGAQAGTSQGARMNLPAWAQSAGLLVVSNVFMTFAWYAHLKNMAAKPWVIAALASWGIALFEYLVQVPANRIGYTTLSLGQLKVMQEVITLAVFVPFAFFYMKQPLKLDFLWAGLCLVAAAYFMFRERLTRRSS